MDLDGEGTAAAVQRFESRLGRTAAGIGVGVVQVPEKGDVWAMLEGGDQEVFDHALKGAGGG